MGSFIDIHGKKFNEWEALEYVGKGKWKCRCSCGNIKILEGRSVRDGRTKSCGHNFNTFKDITNNISGDFKAIEYIGNKLWICKCTTCNKTKKISRNTFNSKQLVCNHKNNDGTTRIYKDKCSDKIGKVFDDFKVIEYLGDSCWNCKCTTCNKTKVIKTYALSHTKHKCNHLNIGDKINDWKILEIIDEYTALCKCSCGIKKEIKIYDIINNKSKSCGHNTNKQIDIVGRTFGNWKVIKYVGNQLYKCECQCGNKTISNINSYSLRSGNSKSCGCLKRELIIQTNIDKYGEISYTKVNNRRELWQIQTLNNKELMQDYLDKFTEGITITELANKLNINYSTLLQKIKKLGLEKNKNIQYNVSSKEKELLNYIESIYNKNVITNKIGIIPSKELDIYIPEKKLAIEFNGTYWHSDIYKNKRYHQQKTIECAKRGIQLIHIFEYEWDKKDYKEKMLKLLNRYIKGENIKIAANDTIIYEIDDNESIHFLNEYHIHGADKSTVNLGCFLDKELIGVMTFGKPRIDKHFEYELIRFCWKDSVKVEGGAEKLFKYFTETYNPASIITYIDISKFTGNVYTRIGFKPIQPNPITEPNYVWVEPNKTIVLTRYDIDEYEKVENKIMNGINYFKIYDSGNLKLAWYNN